MKNGTLYDMLKSMLINFGLSKYMYMQGEASNTVCHILNGVPMKHIEQTPEKQEN